MAFKYVSIHHWKTLKQERTTHPSLAYLWDWFPEISANSKATEQGEYPPETNSSPLKIAGWKTTFLFRRPIFTGYVSFGAGIPWVVPLPRIPVTTRIITFLVEDPKLNLHLPRLLGGGTTQGIPIYQSFWGANEQHRSVLIKVFATPICICIDDVISK